MRKETIFTIRPSQTSDHEWIDNLLTEQWGAAMIVRQGESVFADQLPGWIAEIDGHPTSLVTYQITGNECELTTLNSLVEGIGIGTALVEAIVRQAEMANCRRVWLITTNDNLQALGFYHKRGFRLVKVYPGMVDASRKIKPQISRIGLNGIPIRDEIELELRLNR